MKKISVIILLLFCPYMLLAGTAAVQGRIVELGGSESVAGVLVESSGSSVTAYTDEKGFYTVTVNEGEPELKFSAEYYKDKKIQLVNVEADSVLELDVSLERTGIIADAVIVTAKKEKDRVLASSLTQRQIKKMPGTAGDVLRAVQNLPGVASPNDVSAGLIVQGGGPGDNLYLLDSIPWPYPYHMGGIVSTVSPDLLTSVELNSAGFPARWGGSMGAVLDARTRPGKKDSLHGNADISIMMAQAMLEGPLGLGDASFTISGRRSYIDVLLSTMKDTGFTALPVFWDMGASLDFSTDKDNRFYARYNINNDSLSLEIKDEDVEDPAMVGEFSVEETIMSGGLNWVNNSLGFLRSVLTPYYYKTGTKQKIGEGIDIDMGRDAYGLKEELFLQGIDIAGIKNEITAGLTMEAWDDHAKVKFFRDSVDGFLTDPASTTVNMRTLQRGFFITDRMEFAPWLIFTPGARYDKNQSVGPETIDPRLCLEIKPDEKLSIKTAWGFYSSFPSAEQLNKDFGNPSLLASTAEHAVISAEYVFMQGLSLRADVYHKTYRNLINGNDTPSLMDNKGFGIAKGAELFLQADLGEQFFGGLSYSYSRSDRFDPDTGKWSLYRYDQPHLLTLVSSYNLNPNFSIGGKIRYSSGPLQQEFLGRYQDMNGNWHGVFSPQFTKRLDDNIRVDLRADYTFLFEGWKLAFYYEVINVFDRKNPAGLNYKKDFSGDPVVINNLPRMQLLGVEAEF